jgi:hypothetical protein
MKAALLAGVAYFAGLFGAGSAFGLARFLHATPSSPPLIALLLEVPMILTVAYFVCGWIADSLQVGTSAGLRIMMSVTTFALLVTADFAVSLVLSDEPWRAAADSTGTWGSGPGFAMQVLASTFPLIVPVVRTLTGKSKLRSNDLPPGASR